MSATGPQTDRVVDGVRRLIREGALAAGDRLPAEKELAARLGVTRGPLREGVRALVALGLLETRQGDGTYVTALDARRLLAPVSVLADVASDDDVAHLLVVRRTLEAEAAALAARHATEAQLDALRDTLEEMARLLDDARTQDTAALVEVDSRFHRTLAEASGNSPLAALVEHLVGRTFDARVRRARDERGALRAALAEHRAVLDEVERRDPERARLRMSAHLLGVEDYVLAHPDDDGPSRP